MQNRGDVGCVGVGKCAQVSAQTLLSLLPGVTSWRRRLAMVMGNGTLNGTRIASLLPFCQP